MTNKDAFDLWWEWAEKPLDSPLTIDAEIHEAVMALPARPRKGQLRPVYNHRQARKSTTRLRKPAKQASVFS
jgi:hypothetical protein